MDVRNCPRCPREIPTKDVSTCLHCLCCPNKIPARDVSICPRGLCCPRETELGMSAPVFAVLGKSQIGMSASDLAVFAVLGKFQLWMSASVLTVSAVLGKLLGHISEARLILVLGSIRKNFCPSAKSNQGSPDWKQPLYHLDT